MAYCGPRGIPLSTFLAWHTDDQAAALGWLSLDSQKCGGCGTSGWEWEHDRDAYTAEPWVCPGCARLESAKKDHGETAKHLSGLQIRLTPTRGNGGEGGSDRDGA